jgi:hypothetical protein
MNRSIAIAAVMAAGLATTATASAGATRDAACRTSISSGIYWGGQPLSSTTGALPAHMSAALTAISMQYRYLEFCRQGGQMAYWQYVHTFLRTNGFYLFGQLADAAARRMVVEDSGRLPDAEQPRGTAPPSEPRWDYHRTVQTRIQRHEARVLLPTAEATRTFRAASGTMQVRLPPLPDQVLHIDPNGPRAYVMSGSQVMVFEGAGWTTLSRVEP